MTLCSEHDLPVFVEMGKFAPGTPPEDQDAARLYVLHTFSLNLLSLRNVSGCNVCTLKSVGRFLTVIKYRFWLDIPDLMSMQKKIMIFLYDLTISVFNDLYRFKKNISYVTR